MTTALATLTDQAREYLRAATSEATKRAYSSDWAAWTAWAQEHNTPALPCDPELLATYLSDMADTHKPSSIARALAAITAAHKAAGATSPRGHSAVVGVLKGIRRTKTVAQKQAKPVTPAQLLEATQTASVRDRALLLLTFAGALRRSETVSLDCGDLAFSSQGITLTIRHSKTDQEGQGQVIGIPAGPAVDAVREYMGSRVIGPLFLNARGSRLSADGFYQIIKARLGGDFSGHSLRRGFCSAASRAGADILAIQAQTRHRSLAQLSKYVEHDLFVGNAGTGLL